MTENEQKALIYKYFRTTEVPKGLVLPSDPVLIAGILGDYEAANDLFKEAISVCDEWTMDYHRSIRYIAEEGRYEGFQKGEALDVFAQPEHKILADQINKAQELVKEEMMVLRVIGLNKAMR
jgi:hypothetical protein